SYSPATDSKTIPVTSLPAPTIQAPTSVLPGQANLVATVESHPGSSYLWSIANGTIASGNGTSQITFTAGGAGSLALSVMETDALGCSAASAATSLPVDSGNRVLPTVNSGPGQSGSFVRT